MNKAPIGVFDSGVGGLTVARSIIDQLPQEKIFYIGDTANSPYGDKPLAKVREIAIDVMDNLVAQGVKLLVIACNSASAAVLSEARERYTQRLGLPVVEVIQPAVRTAISVTRNRKIGVIGTQATISSKAYEDAFAVIADIEIYTQACPRFVELVEQGITAGTEIVQVAQQYLADIKARGVDTLVLGCTHYPLLTGVIGYVMGPEVTIVSSAEETVKDVYRELTASGLIAPSESVSTACAKVISSANASQFTEQSGHIFATTGDAAVFENLAKRFLGPAIGQVKQIDLRNKMHKSEINNIDNKEMGI